MSTFRERFHLRCAVARTCSWWAQGFCAVCAHHPWKGEILGCLSGSDSTYGQTSVYSSAVLLDTLIHVCVENWIYFSWQLKNQSCLALFLVVFLWDLFICNLVIFSPHFCIAAIMNPFQLNCCLHFKQMKAYFNVYDLLKQTIGRGRLKFWA